MAATGMEKLLIQARFIAQKQEPFGVGVQPPNWPDIFRELKVRESAVARSFAGKLRQRTEWLVKGDDQKRALARSGLY